MTNKPRSKDGRLTDAQEYALSFIVANSALDFSGYKSVAKFFRTMKILEDKGYIQFFPYSRMSWSKNGVWKPTKQGQAYVMKYQLVE